MHGIIRIQCYVIQEIMAEAAKVPNVVKMTNKASLYEQLEDLQKR